MKQIKLLFFAALALATATARSQEAEVQYTPKSGDYALSVSAIPFTRYIGQFFNGAVSNDYSEFAGQAYIGNDVNTTQFQKIDPMMSISGKYFLDDETAIRVNLGLIYQREFKKSYARDDAEYALNPFSQQKVIDTYLSKNTGMSLMAGLEKRVGKARLQGIYGAGVLFALNNQVKEYTYGNAITDINQSPTESNGGTAATLDGFAYNRLIKDYNLGASWHLGIVTFVGVEYFIIPRMSIGGEVNFTALASFDRPQYQDLEGFSTVDVAKREWTELKSPSSNTITIGTGNIGSNVTLSFYF
ncbi:MAG: hypothetical protein J6V75_01885 [Bacteroidaceae bacterium]|nr:hypothetical protein [Bacteroidaceae bacterium]MBP5348058.1 hypothetical protein [Bacteroidaceae bacterium]